MSTWWTHRSDREKYLLSAALAVVVLFGAYFLLVRPALGFRDQAHQSFMAAQAEFDAVTELANQLQRARPENLISGDDETRSPRVIATSVARGMGLGITRIQPQQNDAVSFWFDDISVQDLFRWMIELQTRSGLSIKSVDIQDVDSGQSVRAQIVISPLP